jgi:hypothetical protein
MKPTLSHVQVSITPEPASKLPFGAVTEAGLRLRSQPSTLRSSSQGLCRLSTLPQSGSPGLCLTLKWTHRLIRTTPMCPLVPLLPTGPPRSPLSPKLLSSIPVKIMQTSPPKLARFQVTPRGLVTHPPTLTTPLPLTLRRTGDHPIPFQDLPPYQRRRQRLWK